MSTPVFEFYKTMYDLKFIRKYINKHKNNISQKNSKIIFKGLRTAAKIDLVEMSLFPGNLITCNSKYK